jgi:hypothetical protein
MAGPPVASGFTSGALAVDLLPGEGYNTEGRFNPSHHGAAHRQKPDLPDYRHE